jgi:ABC-type Na+ efflux pump permease subunit
MSHAPLHVPPSGTDRLARLVRLTRKELAETLRDRRTILTLVLMPLLLYPLLGLVLRQFPPGKLTALTVPVYRLGFRSEDEVRQFEFYRQAGERMLLQAWFKLTDESVKALRAAAVPEGVLSKLNPLKDKLFARREEFLTELGKVLDPDDLARFQDRVVNHALLAGGVFVKTPEDGQAEMDLPSSVALPLPRLEVVLAEDVGQVVTSGIVDVFLLPQRGEPSALPGVIGPAVRWELLYLEDSPQGREAVRHVQRLCEAANRRLLQRQLYRLREWVKPVPAWKDWPALVLQPVMVPLEGGRRPSAFLVLVPLILILMTITGAVYPAIDLTAGERERGTLEILMAAPVPRLSLLLAKYVAVLTVAMLTALVNLGSMSLTLWVSGLGPRLFGMDGLSLLLLVEIFLLLLLFAAFFSAVLLALTSFARSFKEAQAYLIPLMLLALVPGVLSLVPDLPLAGPLVLVPLLNIVLLARDLLLGKAEVLSAVLVVASTVVYALAAVAVAAAIFGAQAVGSRAGGWFGRRHKPEAA